MIFGFPMAFGFAADSPWLLGLLLAISGMAVTPLYINAYLMMDAVIPKEVIHEANTWVPLGNNVGYIFGITAAGALLGRNNISMALDLAAILAATFVVYSAARLYG